MKPMILLTMLTLAAAPMAVRAMPVVGDMIGTTSAEATAALTKAGCDGTKFEAEGGKIDARCSDHATGTVWEVTINPKTGKVVSLKQGD